ncbi:MAG: HAD-IIB family hydrolase [Nitrospiraceae bacterium]|jgi:mannosyl-3-phosphoglycerate phosphatase|nr:MAG: HAD-IIB family hydrolase [Nitrospiraceae bacterium]
MENIVIFTDLDGTLLDYSTYSFEKALPALDIIRQQSVPLILCSSKTRTEIEYYREKLANSHPFVSENGGGIFIPKKYFDSPLSASHPVEEEADYDVIRLGARYSDLRKAVKELQQEGFEITGFGDMTAKELSDMTNMNIEEAVMAKERDFDEPFIYKGPSHGLPHLFRSINQKGFTFTQGRFFHILGSSDKGKAVSILADLYKRKYGEIKTIALGDSPNDIPMLERADRPVLVQKQDGVYDPQIDMPKLIRADGIGPEGWNKAILTLFTQRP